MPPNDSRRYLEELALLVLFFLALAAIDFYIAPPQRESGAPAAFAIVMRIALWVMAFCLAAFGGPRHGL